MEIKRGDIVDIDFDPDLIAVAGTMVRQLEPEINQHNVPILISIVDKTVVYNSKFQIR
jgi:hypothetical protein